MEGCQLKIPLLIYFLLIVHGDSTWYFTSRKLEFYGAQAECEETGGTLLEALDTPEDILLLHQEIDYVLGDDEKDIWIGLQPGCGIASQWQSGRALVYPASNSDDGDNQICFRWDKQRNRINDMRCSGKMYGICETGPAPEKPKFFLGPKEENFEREKNKCHELGAELVEITSGTVEEDLKTFIMENDCLNNYWIGIDPDSPVMPDRKWLSGEDATLTSGFAIEEDNNGNCFRIDVQETKANDKLKIKSFNCDDGSFFGICSTITDSPSPCSLLGNSSIINSSEILFNETSIV